MAAFDSTQELPYEGELFKARKKKYAEVVFFVHFYGGVKKQLLRHVRFVNQLGYDAFTFQLQGNHHDILNFNLPISSEFALGLKHIYADQIEILLNDIPGQKIVYAFSNPAGSAIEAIARRNCSDVAALICDSGPSARLLPSTFRLFTYDLKIKFLPLRLLLSPPFALLWSPHMHKDIQTDLEKFPTGFRILSIRGWKDKLIPPAHIDEVFDPHPQLDWQKLSLPEADHLVGLRDFKKEYAPVVERFLKSVSTELSSEPSTELPAARRQRPKNLRN